MNWAFAEPTEAAAHLARELRLAPAVATILASRGFESPEKAGAFLNPRLSTLSDPFELKGMEPTVNRLLKAIDCGERIVLHGDYDVDGVSSLALLERVLTQLGATVSSFLPMRLDEGYGLTIEGLKRCLAQHKPQLLVAVDCGTNAFHQVEWLAAQGVDALIIDHHEPEGDLPKAIGMINPKAFGEECYFCSAGLVFKVCHALLKRRPRSDIDLRMFLDLVALGTIADLVPLLEENRIFASKGLARMTQTRWNGLRALQEISAIEGHVKASDVSFRIGPRLNAAGRLGDAAEALRLLLTGDPAEARKLAVKLDNQNRERQTVEQRTVKEALKQVCDLGMETAHAIVVGGDGWHPGVVGIAASRLSRQFHRPAIVIAFEENGSGRGSGRGIDNICLLDPVKECGHLLERFGGHSMAVGLSVRRENFEEFRKALIAAMGRQTGGSTPETALMIDAFVDLAELTENFVDQHEQLAPFGMGNAQPVFCARGVVPISGPVVMQDKHFRVTVGTGTQRLDAVFFNAPLAELPKPPWDMAFQIERSVWRSEERCQLHIRALAAAS